MSDTWLKLGERIPDESFSGVSGYDTEIPESKLVKSYIDDFITKNIVDKIASKGGSVWENLAAAMATPVGVASDLFVPSTYGELAMPLPKSLRGKVTEIKPGELPEGISDKAKDLLNNIIKKTRSLKITDDSDDIYGTTFDLEILHPKGNKRIGNYVFDETDDYVQSQGSYVEKPFRRQGITSDIYALMEDLTNKKMIRGDIQSEDALALWSNPNRKFGDRNREYSPHMEELFERNRLIGEYNDEVKKLDSLREAIFQKYGEYNPKNITPQEDLEINTIKNKLDLLNKRIRGGR